MLDAVTALLTYQASSAFATGATPGRMGNRHPSIAPYDTFAASDGEFVLVGRQRRPVPPPGARSSAARSSAADPRFATNADRVANHEALREELSAALSARGRGRICLQALTRAPACRAGAVRSVTEALADPQLAAREMIVPLEHLTAGPIRVLGTPLKLSETPASIRTPPPALGQHTATILAR